MNNLQREVIMLRLLLNLFRQTPAPELEEETGWPRQPQPWDDGRGKRYTLEELEQGMEEGWRKNAQRKEAKEAAARLKETERGQLILQRILEMVDHEGLGADEQQQQDAIMLLQTIWADVPEIDAEDVRTMYNGEKRGEYISNRVSWGEEAVRRTEETARVQIENAVAYLESDRRGQRSLWYLARWLRQDRWRMEVKRRKAVSVLLGWLDYGWLELMGDAKTGRIVEEHVERSVRATEERNGFRDEQCV